MTSSRSERHVIVLTAAALSILILGVAEADISVEQKLTVSGSGLMKMANMNGKSVTTIAGDSSRSESEMTFESAMVRMLARGAGGQTIEIVKLGEDKIYELNPKKKTYTETTFTARREQLQKAIASSQEAQATQQRQASGVDESQCEWSPPKSDVKRTGEKATFAGYQAEHVIISATQACKDRKTGQVCEFGLTMDQWMAADFKESAETLAYQKAFAEKMGLTPSTSRDFSERAESLFGGYKAMWTDIATKMKDVKGYPVKSSFGLGVGGAQCQTAQSAAQSGEGDEAPSLGSALGGALGGLGGLIGKKRDTAKPAAVPPPVAANGLIPLMTISNEIVAVKHDAAEPSAFAVPAGYKKVSE